MPLTTQGIATQILGSIATFQSNREICTTNDCKVVVNHLVRKFSEPSSRMSTQKRMRSIDVANGLTDDTVEDHAVPVIVIVEQLLELPSDRLEVNAANLEFVETLLIESLLLVEISREEDAKLSKCGYQRRMPEDWYIEAESGRKDPLARYKAAKIAIVSIPA